MNRPKHTTPRLETINEILERGYRSASMLLLMHFKTRKTVQIDIKNGKVSDPNIDADSRDYIFRASFP